MAKKKGPARKRAPTPSAQRKATRSRRAAAKPRAKTSRKPAPHAPPPPKKERASKQLPEARELQQEHLRIVLERLKAQRSASECEPLIFPNISHMNQAAFLAAYAECGNVTQSARAARIDRRTHLNWLKDSEAYREAFEDAKEHAADLLEQEAIRRARIGVDKPVYQMGMLVGMVREFSDSLLTLLLKGNRSEKYRERHEHTGKDGAELFAAADERLAGFLAEVAAARDADAATRDPR